MTSEMVRDLHPGMGVAVAERTVLRRNTNGDWETWADVADRVANGNSWLAMILGEQMLPHAQEEYAVLNRHIAKATLLMSGRHLQHGDGDQINRNMEVFTNCSTSITSFTMFMLLLNGSGVGRSYDDDLCLVNWNYSPNLRVVISSEHADFQWGADEDSRDARHKYRGKNVIWHEVADTREGWAKAIELWETLTFEKVHFDKTLVLDFSNVRPRGAPIMGMQGRPSSGPKPLMDALNQCATIKGSGMQPWLQSLYFDHYMACCVLVGGARRSARMSTKWWLDEDIVDFIQVKRPIEYQGLAMDEVVALRDERKKTGLPPLMPFLWSSNNSVMVDKEFWEHLEAALSIRNGRLGTLSNMSRKQRHAIKVWEALTEAAYADGTGEPGIINADQLVSKIDGWETLANGQYVGSDKYQVNDDTITMLSRLAREALKKQYPMITNPCGEIALTVLGGYCVIADTVPFHCDTLDEAEDVMRATTRALMRVNMMDSLYKNEVRRTNRIGVGMTGVHEFAWKFFEVGFRDLIAPDFHGLKEEPVEYEIGDSVMQAGARSKDARVRSAAFWMTLSRFSNAIVDEAKKYAEFLGVPIPHTMLTIKPAGTTSKLFGLTEGWHLPSMREYLRWVQFRHDDPLVAEYRAKGYPTRELKQYQGTVIVGFPTRPTICEVMPPKNIVLAGDASPEDQYLWLRLGEQFWIDGQTDPFDRETGHGYGNQISYTLKYKPEVTGYTHFERMLRKWQPLVRCCSVMPQEDATGGGFEYLPEQSLAKAEYEAIARAISEVLAEDVGREHMDCSTGACPIDFKEGLK